ncbi:hypothetical protein, partial [Rheinheimera sp.]|uniref:hypothetical protein n=1 Tax=Rheinheimera sp. TaxID=1869214 RepID=UPI0025CCF6CB
MHVYEIYKRLNITNDKAVRNATKMTLLNSSRQTAWLVRLISLRSDFKPKFGHKKNQHKAG